MGLAFVSYLVCLTYCFNNYKLLQVPDFDSVTCTLTMPTDMVECIRKNLERSQSSSSVSVEQEGENVSRVRFWRVCFTFPLDK